MPSRKKIDLEKVRACLDTICTKCGYRIPPAEILRLDFEWVKCPPCGSLLCRVPIAEVILWHRDGAEAAAL